MRDLIRLIKAWLSGRYRVFPWWTFFVLILVAVYAVNPFDIVPDFIPGVGIIDDAAMLGFLVRALLRDVSKFKEWERAQSADSGSVPPAQMEVRSTASRS